MGVLGGWAFSYERVTPVNPQPQPLHRRRYTRRMRPHPLSLPHLHFPAPLSPPHHHANGTGGRGGCRWGGRLGTRGGGWGGAGGGCRFGRFERGCAEGGRGVRLARAALVWRDRCGEARVPPPPEETLLSRTKCFKSRFAEVNLHMNSSDHSLHE